MSDEQLRRYPQVQDTVWSPGMQRVGQVTAYRQGEITLRWDGGDEDTITHTQFAIAFDYDGDGERWCMIA